MNVFVDANIIVSVLNKEYPLFPFTARILSLSDRSDINIFTSPICLAIAFYFVGKKQGDRYAKQKIDLLCQHIFVSESTADHVRHALSNPRINDFEVGLEYFSALQNKCDYILTENKEDFYFSAIPVLNSVEFIEHYSVR